MNLRAVFSLIGLVCSSSARILEIISRDETSTVPPADVGGAPLLDPEGIGTSVVPPADDGVSFVLPESATMAGNEGPQDEVSGNEGLFAEAEDEVAAVFDYTQPFRICSDGRCLAPTACSGTYPLLTTKPKRNQGEWQWWVWENDGRIRNSWCPDYYITYQEGWDLYLQGWAKEDMEMSVPTIQKWDYDKNWASWTTLIPYESKQDLKLKWGVYQRTRKGHRVALSGDEEDFTYFELIN
jgi:hypothetical protein